MLTPLNCGRVRRTLGLTVLGFLVLCQMAVAQETFPSHVAQMYPAETGQVWAEVLKVLQDVGLEVIDQEGRFLVTQPVDVEFQRFGFGVGALGDTFRSGRVTFHVFVPPFIEPARVYVGSVLEALSTDSTSRSRPEVATRLYNANVFGAWLLRKVAERLAVPGHDIPTHPPARQALGLSLVPSAINRCGASLNPSSSGIEPPVKIHDEQPVHPLAGQQRGDERTVVLEAALGEDGFAWPVKIVRGATAKDEFGRAALGAVSLWRFRPARIGSCLLPVIMTVTATFSIR